MRSVWVISSGYDLIDEFGEASKDLSMIFEDIYPTSSSLIFKIDNIVKVEKWRGYVRGFPNIYNSNSLMGELIESRHKGDKHSIDV